MKNKFILGIFFALWIATLAPMRSLNVQPAVVRHPFLNLTNFKLTTIGFAPALFEEQFQTASRTLDHFVELGYQLRFRLLDFTRFLTYSADPVDESKLQLVVREEIPTDFEGEHTDEIQTRLAESISQRANLVMERTHAAVAVLIVPTKVASNRLNVSLGDFDIRSFRFWQLDSHARRGNAFDLQARLEWKLSEKIPVLPILATYRDLQHQKQILYPRSESHWSGDVLTELAPKFAAKLREVGLIAPTCIRHETERLQRTGENANYLGDLFTSLAWKANFQDAKKFTDTVALFDKKQTIQPTLNPACPDILIAGTSYGDSHFSGIKLSDALQFHYAGKVEDRSVVGRGPIASLRALKDPFEKPSIIIWEIPYRLLNSVEDRE